MSSTDISTNFILKKIKEKNSQNMSSYQNIVKSNSVDDKVIEVELNFELKYLTTKDQNLFMI